jgi:hypothetical protein
MPNGIRIQSVQEVLPEKVHVDRAIFRKDFLSINPDVFDDDDVHDDSSAVTDRIEAISFDHRRDEKLFVAKTTEDWSVCRSIWMDFSDELFHSRILLGSTARTDTEFIIGLSIEWTHFD